MSCRAIRIRLGWWILGAIAAAGLATAVGGAGERERLCFEPTVTWLPRPINPPPEAEADSAETMRVYREHLPGSTVAFDLLPVRGGRIRTGSPPEEAGRSAADEPRREVDVEPFWMGKCEVTWAEYDLWEFRPPAGEAGARPVSATEHDRLADAVASPSLGYVDMSQGLGRGLRPAAGMSQLAAKLYCQWLSAKTGHYYRLPTDAEWECACRAGTDTAYSFGPDAAALGRYAWYEDNSELAAHPVGQKAPNAWGFHDLHGNLAEWVLDAAAGQGTPPPFATAHRPRFVRGGSFDDPAERVRSAARRGSSEAWQTSDPNLPKSIWWIRDAPFVGFRVVRPLRVPTLAESARAELDAAQRAQLQGFLDRMGAK